MATKHGLARGLDALLPETDLPAGVTEIAVSQLDPNPDQPRRTFDTQALEALAESIRQAGVLQPLLVVENGARYRIVAGAALSRGAHGGAAKRALRGARYDRAGAHGGRAD